MKKIILVPQCYLPINFQVNRMFLKGLRKVLLVLLLVFVVLVRFAQAEATLADRYDEYMIKAAFIYNFAKFIEWPEESFTDAKSPLSLCILGQNPFGNMLVSLGTEETGGRRLVIRESKRVEEAIGCHIVFISGSEKKNLKNILARFDNLNILTIGDMTNFAKSGGTIKLDKVEERIRFEINVDAARRAGLVISSEVLDLAEIVR